jgi:glycosyltransferase involved in cell wall biosynthesis
VVPTYKRPELLRRCLSALQGQDYPSDRYEVIVVEDGGPAEGEGVVEEIRRTSPVRILYMGLPHAGPAAARNRGWSAARGELIAFTDDDTIPDRQWLAEGAKSFVNGADVVNGHTIVPLPPFPSDADKNTQGLERATLATCNAFCRRSLLEANGGFDTRFTRAYREDSDLEFTLRKGGAWLVSNPHAVVVHPPRAEPRFVSLRQQRNQFFDALLYRKHPEQFRQSIRAWPPVTYYGIAVAQLVTLLGALTRRRGMTWFGTLVWLPLVLRFFQQRARGTSRDMRHRAELLVTSAVIPILAVYWRLRGALAFRVFFL